MNSAKVSFRRVAWQSRMLLESRRHGSSSTGALTGASPSFLPATMPVDIRRLVDSARMNLIEDDYEAINEAKRREVGRTFICTGDCPIF